MRPVTKSLHIIALGIALLAASGPAISYDGIPAHKGISKNGRGADKIGWARKYRAWCKENADRPQCDYVDSVVSPKCVQAHVKNFKNACLAST